MSINFLLVTDVRQDTDSQLRLLGANLTEYAKYFQDDRHLLKHSIHNFKLLPFVQGIHKSLRQTYRKEKQLVIYKLKNVQKRH